MIENSDQDLLVYLMDQGMDDATIRYHMQQEGCSLESLYDAVQIVIRTDGTWKKRFPPVEDPDDLQLISFEDVVYEEPKWLIKPYFPGNKITIVQGDPGTGKTAFMCGIAALVSTGSSLLGKHCEQGNVLLISVEDDASVLRGRLEADGADLSRCKMFPEAATAGLTFDDPRIEKMIVKHHIKLVVFDPLQAFLGAIDMNKANETRPVLAKLKEMAERTDCAVVIISHMAKGQTKGIYRALGSIDIVGSSRSVLHIGRDPDNKDSCVACHIKCNTGKMGESFTYQIGDRGGITWGEFTDLTEEDLDRAAKKKQLGIEYDDEPVVAVVRAVLADNPSGTFLSYDAFQRFGEVIAGFYPASNNTELRKKIDCLRVDLMRKDQIKVYSDRGREREYVRRGKTIQTEGKSVRGVRIEPYHIQKEFQTSIGL